MKKILSIFVVVILIVIIALPFFGNKAVELILKDRIEVLNSYGLEVLNTKADSTYFKSQNHYSIFVKDADKFIVYLNQFSSTQIPAYVNVMLEGIKLETKIEYCNIPLTDGISVEISPVKLSQNIMNRVKNHDVGFAKYFSDFLSNKGFTYYLNYNILSKDFDGHIKDISENYTLKSGYKVDVKLSGATFVGDGTLIAPNNFNSKIDEIYFKIDKDSEKLEVLFSNISEYLAFKSKTNYSVESNIKSIRLDAVGMDLNKSKIIIDNVSFDFSTNVIDKKTNFFAKATFDNLLANTTEVAIDLDKFIYDMSLTKLDEESFELILKLIEDAKIIETQEMKDLLAQNMITLLSKGLELKILDLSLVKIILNKNIDLEGISLKADFILPPNDVLSNQEAGISEIMQKVKIDLLLDISKKMFSELSKTQPMLIMAQSFAKEGNNNLIFNIKVKDGNITVNDKAIQ